MIKQTRVNTEYKDRQDEEEIYVSSRIKQTKSEY